MALIPAVSYAPVYALAGQLTGISAGAIASSVGTVTQVAGAVGVVRDVVGATQNILASSSRIVESLDLGYASAAKRVKTAAGYLSRSPKDPIPAARRLLNFDNPFSHSARRFEAFKYVVPARRVRVRRRLLRRRRRHFRRRR